MKYVFRVYVAIVAVMSLVALVAYGWDKRRARLEGRLLPDLVLPTAQSFISTA